MTAVSTMPNPISCTSPTAPGTIFGISSRSPSSRNSTANAPTHRAPHAAEPAEHGHQQELHRQREVRRVRVDHREPVRVERRRPAPRTRRRARTPAAAAGRCRRRGISAATSESLTAPSARPIRLVDEVAGHQQRDHAPPAPAARSTRRRCRSGGRRTPASGRRRCPRWRRGTPISVADDRHDDAQAERRQRQVVPAQPQQRQADQQRGEHRQRHRDDRGRAPSAPRSA